MVKEKSIEFSLMIIDVYKYLQEEQREYIMSKQLLRSATSIGANISEAGGSYSKKEFYAKLSISYKEARETKYWLELLFSSDYLNSNQYQYLLNKCEELCKILYTIMIKWYDSKKASSH